MAEIRVPLPKEIKVEVLEGPLELVVDLSEAQWVMGDLGYMDGDLVWEVGSQYGVLTIPNSIVQIEQAE